MGEADRAQEYKKPKKRFSLGQENNALVFLVSANAVVFLLLLFLQVAFSFSENNGFDQSVLSQISIPSNFTTFSEKPWTIFTFMFADTLSNLFRLLSNMLWLWAFGYVLQQMAGNDKIIPVYIYGGIVGGLAFMISSHIVAGPVNMLGANSSVIAVATATTTLNPRFRFFRNIRGGVAIWVLLAIYLIIDLIGVAGNFASYSISHLAAASAGCIFIILYRKGIDGSVWMNKAYFNFIKLFEPAKNKNSQTYFYNTKGKPPFTKTPNISQERIDEILDKINQYGTHFLTQEELDYLKKASEENE